MFLFVVVWRWIPEALQVRVKHRHQQCMPGFCFQGDERMPRCSAFNYTSIIPPAPKTASTGLTAFPHQPFSDGVRRRAPQAQPIRHRCGRADVLTRPGCQGWVSGNGSALLAEVGKAFLLTLQAGQQLHNLPPLSAASVCPSRRGLGQGVAWGGPLCAAYLAFLGRKAKSGSERGCWCTRRGRAAEPSRVGLGSALRSATCPAPAGDGGVGGWQRGEDCRALATGGWSYSRVPLSNTTQLQKEEAVGTEQWNNPSGGRLTEGWCCHLVCGF